MTTKEETLERISEHRVVLMIKFTGIKDRKASMITTIFKIYLLGHPEPQVSECRPLCSIAVTLWKI